MSRRRRPESAARFSSFGSRTLDCQLLIVHWILDFRCGAGAAPSARDDGACGGGGGGAGDGEGAVARGGGGGGGSGTTHGDGGDERLGANPHLGGGDPTERRVELQSCYPFCLRAACGYIQAYRGVTTYPKGGGAISTESRARFCQRTGGSQVLVYQVPKRILPKGCTCFKGSYPYVDVAGYTFVSILLFIGIRSHALEPFSGGSVGRAGFC